MVFGDVTLLLREFVDDALLEDDEFAVEVEVVEAKSKVVVESTANSVGEPTSSKLMEFEAELGPVC